MVKIRIPYKWHISLLSIITAASLGITAWALFFRETTTDISPDYPPQQVEENAEPVPGGDEDKLTMPVGGGAVSLAYSDQVKIDLNAGIAELKFINPGKSIQNLIVQIVIQDTVIVQSGKLLPGNQVKQLDLLPNAAESLSAGGYNGTFVVSYYDSETEEKALINTVIPITIMVYE